MELPTKKTKPMDDNPKFTILFGKPKSGKTTIVSGLNDALLMDTEHGSSYVEAMKVDISNLQKLKELKMALNEAYKSNNNKHLYTYGILDTATALEDVVHVLAINKYKASAVGKNYTGNDLRILANGAGYLWLREAFIEVINGLKPYFKYMILLGHTKDKMINKEGKELSENTLDLTGKLERIMCSQADALGFVYRKKNQTIINFNGGDDNIVEARPVHLRGREIVIAESDKDNKIKTYWERIFI